MTAISAAAMTVRTMADGSLRITVEVEPQDAQKAFALFGKPGAPMALAALAEGHAAVKEPEPKGGERAKWVAMRCKEESFRNWAFSWWPALSREVAPHLSDEEAVAEIVRKVCGVKSRAELDTDGPTGRKFDALVRKPWFEFVQGMTQ